MPYLVAQGKKTHQRWRRSLKNGQSFSLGRTVPNWNVPWDQKISRSHIDALWNGDRLQITIRPDASNPVFFMGEEQNEFGVRLNQHFIIGDTEFRLTDDRANISLDIPHPVTEQYFSQEQLRSSDFHNARQQIDALSRLPELVSEVRDHDELVVQLVNLVLSGIADANAVAVVAVESTSSQEVVILHWDRPLSNELEFSPSERLIRSSLSNSKSVIHTWFEADDNQSPEFTQSAEQDWAFCTPIRFRQASHWAIYVAGKKTLDMEIDDLHDDLKFSEIVATTVSNACDLQAMQKREIALSRFFSPALHQTILSGDPNAILAPRETEVCVLFCDLRGFSRHSEMLADDLLALLERVSKALGIATNRILENGGVIGDFHGDAAMGFWGWPIEQSDMAVRSFKTAQRIQQDFAEKQAGQNFRLGIGIAMGNAVAGTIGTIDQQKVTAFGPVVNIASRFEGLTKIFGVDILVDERIAKVMDRDDSVVVRKIASVRPYGMSNALGAYQVVADDSLTQIFQDYSDALDAFESGDWKLASKIFADYEKHDGPSFYLKQWMNRYGQIPPESWNGVVSFDFDAAD